MNTKERMELAGTLDRNKLIYMDYLNGIEPRQIAKNFKIHPSRAYKIIKIMKGLERPQNKKTNPFSSFFDKWIRWW